MRHTIRSIQLAGQRPDKPGDAERRILEREAGAQAHREAMARFGEVTPANFDEFAAWQESRRLELLAQNGA